MAGTGVRLAEAEKRSLSSCVELKFCRLEKGKDGSKAFAINTQEQWDEERSLLSGSTTSLQVNVLRKEITFEKASPVIKVCLATDNADTSKPICKPRRTGRKRSATKLEDEELVKRIKRGRDFERNERQRKDLEEMNKVQVENLHAVGHFKDQFPTLLLYAQNLANIVYESIKRVVPWSTYYFTHDKSYYPVLRQSTQLNAIPKLEHLNARRELNRQEKDLMIEWATNNGRAARQRSVRQETTTFKAGTLPLNMYKASHYPKHKVSISHNTIQKGTVTSATAVTIVTPSTSHEAIEDDKVVEAAEVEEEEEYDTDSDAEYSIADNDEEDSLDDLVFIRAVTARSGRMVRVIQRE
ncbi:hypothetical protein AWC38_SpisGene22544 [Stylophora pistillata]|uniref:Uncharacterized protein n=1 Tax=Stylophora pistillata TaxID=50429 RepID=A0A2B4RAR3_STYPI|nr:hypothetical protein AWC38_SpisGene22544 [Stylophora pistillata]